MAKRATKRKKKVRVNLSNWEWGDWPDDLEKGISVNIEKDGNSFEISIDLKPEVLERAVRKIATEVIEVFFKEPFGLDMSVCEEGISISSPEMNQEVIVPWSKIYLGTESNLAALEEWKKEQIELWGDE